MKYLRVFPVLALLVLYMGSASNTLAYGGGGFPPGYFDNPNARPGLVCKLEKKELPNGRIINIPRCKVVRNADNNENLARRINDFLARLRNGGR